MRVTYRLLRHLLHLDWIRGLLTVQVWVEHLLPSVRRLVRRQGMGVYYLCFLGATGVMVVLTLLVRATTPLTADQSYFVVVLSVLLMHYYFDHFLFVHPNMVD